MIALTGLAITFPIFIFVSILLALSNRGSPFFVQQRPGWHEVPFWVIKFKTMNDVRDEKGELLPDEQRLTVIGRFVRKTSLDELPQLINVIRGDMSLVGPRPLLMNYLPLYSPRQRARHAVRPGITGWAQVNGRNSIPWRDKFEYDLWYVNNVSFLLDARIILLSVWKIVRASGINEPGKATVTPFDGNN